MNRDREEHFLIMHNDNCPDKGRMEDIKIIHDQNCFDPALLTLSNTHFEPEQEFKKFKDKDFNLPFADKKSVLLGGKNDLASDKNNLLISKIINENSSLSEEVDKLRGELEFVLEKYDQSLKYLNRYHNILYESNKILPLHRFCQNELIDFYKEIEDRLLYNKASSLSKLENSSTNEHDNCNLKIRQLLKELDDERNKRNKLKDELNKLKDSLDRRMNESADRIKQSADILQNTNFSEQSDNDTLITKPKDKSNKKSYSGKFKKIHNGNLYDKYSNKQTSAFISGHWAGDGFTSSINGNKAKYEISDKIDLSSKQLIPVKLKTFAHLLNKVINPEECKEENNKKMLFKHAFA